MKLICIYVYHLSIFGQFMNVSECRSPWVSSQSGPKQLMKGQSTFIGHFALGTMVKPLALTLPIWALVIAPQFMDLLFLPLVAVGVEGQT
jgi:hypothetical protein